MFETVRDMSLGGYPDDYIPSDARIRLEITGKSKVTIVIEWNEEE